MNGDNFELIHRLDLPDAHLRQPQTVTMLPSNTWVWNATLGQSEDEYVTYSQCIDLSNPEEPTLAAKFWQWEGVSPFMRDQEVYGIVGDFVLVEAEFYGDNDFSRYRLYDLTDPYNPDLVLNLGEDYVFFWPNWRMLPTVKPWGNLLIDFAEPSNLVNLANSGVVETDGAFNGKYFLGGFRSRSLTISEFPHGLILQPEFIDFPPMNITAAPSSHEASWSGGSVRSDLMMDTSPITTTWTASLVEGGSWVSMEEDHEDIAPTEEGYRVDAGSLTFTFDANLSPHSRTAIAHVRPAGPEAITTAVNVTQAGIDMIVSPLDFAMEPQGETVNVSIDIANAPIQWYAAVGDDAAWVSLTSENSGTGNGSITLDVAENTAEVPRVATVRIWTDFGHAADISIGQRSYIPGDLAVSHDAIRVDGNAHIINVDVTNIGDFELEWVAWVRFGNWLRIANVRDNRSTFVGRGSDTLEVFIPENDGDSTRRGLIAIREGDATEPQMFVPVFQEGSFRPTDVDRDGSVGSTDIQRIINAVTTGDNSCNCADVNGDGQVNSLDIQAVINAVLGMKAGLS